MKKSKITKHAEIRIEERLGLKGKIKNHLKFKKALKHGKNVTYFSGEFRRFLNNKIKVGLQLKVFDRNIWLYEKNFFGSKLVTVYNIEEKYYIFLDKEAVHNKLCALNARLNRLKSHPGQLHKLIKDIKTEDNLIQVKEVEQKLNKLIEEQKQKIEEEIRFLR